MKNLFKIESKRGETLITLLVFMVVAITVTTTATLVILANSLNASNLEVGLIAENIAESGIENALLRLLRDPSYTGETLTVGQGTATVVVTGTNPVVITSTGKLNNVVRKIQVTAGNNSGILAVTPPWQEVP
jgi:hypothetical protein